MSEREGERLRPTSADAQMVFREVPKEEYRAWLKSIEPTTSEANMEHYRKMFKRAYGEDLRPQQTFSKPFETHYIPRCFIRPVTDGPSTLMEGKTMTDGDAGDAGATPEPTKTPEKTFTQDELNEIVGKEKAKLKASIEREQREQAKKDAEAQELARLDGEAKLRKEWEIKERELSERASKAEHDLAVSNVRASLSAKGYADIQEIAPYLVGKDAEETELIVSKFDTLVQKIVAEKVTGSLARGTPPDPAKGASTPVDELEQALNKAMGLRG